MATKYYALLTSVGAAKLANATALGAQVEITQMAVGDGNGVLPTPNPAQTALTHELRRAQLNMLTIDPVNTNQIIAEQVIPEDVGGWWIREIGLSDKDGDMIAVANCAETYKPQLQEGSGRVQVIRVILIVSSTEVVTLKIDPSVVLATRKYVDDAVIEVKAYMDDVMKKHVEAENPHHQYPLTANALKEMADAGLISKVLENLRLGDSSGYVGRLLNIQVFKSTAQYTPTAGTKSIIVEAIAGGGGSLACSTASGQTGGSSAGYYGQYNKSRFQMSDLTTPVSVTVGAGGGANAAGGSTFFGSYMSLDGGKVADGSIAASGVGVAGNAYTRTGYLNTSKGNELSSSKGCTVAIQIVQVTAGVAVGFQALFSPFPGGWYGRGADGAYLGSGESTAGKSGNPGIVIVWEYA